MTAADVEFVNLAKALSPCLYSWSDGKSLECSMFLVCATHNFFASMLSFSMHHLHSHDNTRVLQLVSEKIRWCYYTGIPNPRQIKVNKDLRRSFDLHASLPI